VVDRRFIFGGHEKNVFCAIMRGAAGFYGVNILTYCLMSNHFHMLVEVPYRDYSAISDQEFEARLKCLYRADEVRAVVTMLNGCRQAGRDEAAENLKRRFTYRMGDVSEFMKSVKLRFSHWYNSRNNREGTLWQERFRSVLVEDGNALLTMAAYIDLNAVRGGIVSDAKDYRYCGYGAATAGDKDAQCGLRRILAKNENARRPNWRESSKRYRLHVYHEGRVRHNARGDVVRPGYSKEEIKKVVEEGGRLSRGDILLCRVRYFSDGMAIGGQAFVDDVFQEFRVLFNAKDQIRPQEMKYGEWNGLCAAHHLGKNVVSVPA